MCRTVLGTVFLKIFHEFLNGASLVEFSVIITLEHLQKSPLRPLVIFRVAGAHLTVPVIAETYLIKLLTIATNILVGGDFRVLTRLDGILLSRQSIGIIAHGMQHIKSFQPLVTRIDIAGNVAQRMAHMQSCSRGVGEHVEDIEFGFRVVNFHLIDFVVLPVALPLFLYFFKIIFHYYVLIN